MFAKKILGFFISLAIVAVFAAGFCFSKIQNVESAKATSTETILSSLGISASTGSTIKNGNTTYVTMSVAGTNDYLTYLEIQASNWATVSSFQIRKIIGNNVYTLSKDDQFTALNCFFSSNDEKPATSQTFFFSQNGTYIVTLTTKSNLTLHSVFSFKQLNGTNFASTSNVSFSFQTFSGEKTNVFYGFGDSTKSFNLNLNENLFSLYAGETQLTEDVAISNNSLYESSLSILNANGNNVSTFSFLVLTKLPIIEFKNNAGTVVDDLVSKFNTAAGTSHTSSVLFFNETVSPTLNFENFEEGQSSYKKLFSIQVVSNQSTRTASLVLNSAEKQTIGEEKTFQTTTSYNNFFSIRKGSEAGNEYLLSSITPLTTVYTFENLYFSGKTSIDVLSHKSQTNEVESKYYIICKNASTTVAAFEFTWIQYNETHALSLTESGGGIFNISVGNIEGNRINVPIDLTISINGQLFSYLDIFNDKNLTVLTNSITLSGAGSFVVNAKYRDSTDNVNFNQTITIVNPGYSISVKTTSNDPISKNQIISTAAKIQCNSVYDIYFGGTLIGTYLSSQIHTTTKSGTYFVVCGDQSFSFTTLTETMNQYSVSTYENVTPVSIYRELTEVTIKEPYTLLSQSGTYYITNENISEISIISFDETIQLQTTTENTYSVSISPVTFTLLSNVANGTRTSSNITLQTVNANGDWTISIEFNGKTTTYTKDAYSNLSKKARTLTNNGTYKVTLVDGDGNSYQVVYTKYYKLNAIIIILIAVAIGGVLFTVFAFLRVRGKTKVK